MTNTNKAPNKSLINFQNLNEYKDLFKINRRPFGKRFHSLDFNHPL